VRGDCPNSDTISCVCWSSEATRETGAAPASSAAAIGRQQLDRVDQSRGLEHFHYQAKGGGEMSGTATTNVSTIAEFRDAILSDYQARNARPSTILGIRRILRIFPRAGITRIEDLNDEGIELVQKWVDNNPDLCPRTRVRYLKTLKTVCRIGDDLGLLPEKLNFTETRPVTSFPNTKEIPWIDQSDARQLLRHLQKKTGSWKGHRTYALLAFGTSD
jgi:hypothetical protein